MDEATKKRIKFIGIVTLILLILAIALVLIKDKQDKIEKEEGTLPDTDKTEYNPLQTANDDFTALEEATEKIG